MKRVYLVLLSSVILTACTQDKTTDVEPSAMGLNKIYATIEAPEESRVQLNDQLQTVWNKGDEITVFGINEYSRWTFDGETGDRSGSFTKKENYTAVADKFDKYYAITSTDGYIDYEATTASRDEMIVHFPEAQNYVPGSYGSNANIMLGSSADGNSFDFKNVSGYLRVSLTGDKVVERVEVFGNNGETLSGRTIFNYKNVSNPKFRWETGAFDRVYVDCGEGVQLSEEPTDFTLALIPQRFDMGFTICVRFTDGTVFPKTTSKAITIQRNRISPMKVTATNLTDWQKAYIYHTGPSIAFPQVKVGDMFPSGCIYWGDDIVSNLSDAEGDYVFKDNKASHTVTVQSMGANTLQLSHCTGVTKIDLSNF